MTLTEQIAEALCTKMRPCGHCLFAAPQIAEALKAAFELNCSECNPQATAVFIKTLRGTDD